MTEQTVPEQKSGLDLHGLQSACIFWKHSVWPPGSNFRLITVICISFPADRSELKVKTLIRLLLRDQGLQCLHF